MQRQEIVDIIIDQVNQYNDNLEKKVDLLKGDESILFGKGGVLDSVDFVSLVLDIESAVEEASGKSLTLADSRALSQKNSPFRTVGTLADYIMKSLETDNG